MLDFFHAIVENIVTIISTALVVVTGFVAPVVITPSPTPTPRVGVFDGTTPTPNPSIAPSEEVTETIPQPTSSPTGSLQLSENPSINPPPTPSTVSFQAVTTFRGSCVKGSGWNPTVPANTKLIYSVDKTYNSTSQQYDLEGEVLLGIEKETGETILSEQTLKGRGEIFLKDGGNYKVRILGGNCIGFTLSF
jgi:hypothetical protein